MGASTGQVGTARAQMQMREILAYVQADTVAVPEVLVAHAGQKFDDEGRFTDEVGRRVMRQLLEHLSRALAASTAVLATARGQN
jgi:chromate reductase